MPEITIWVSDEVARRLAVLHAPSPNLVGIVAELVDHAQQGVYRPGAWQREWVCQAFGCDWLARLVPDTRPEMLSADGRVIFERPAGEGGSDDDR